MSNIDNILYNTNVDNSTFNGSIDPKNLEDRLYFTLLNKNIIYCANQPIDSAYCNLYYNNANMNITKRLNSEYNNISPYIYSNPVNAVYIPFSTVDITIPSTCTPLAGRNRTLTQTATYTFPIAQPHDPYIQTGFANDIINIKGLNINNSKNFTNTQTNESIQFTRINDRYPEKYTLTKIIKCSDIPYWATTDIDNLWNKTTGCISNLSNFLTTLNTTYDALQYTQSTSDISAIFSKYTKPNLISNSGIASNSTDIQKCFGTNNYLTISRSDQFDITNSLLKGVKIPTMLYPGIMFDNINGNVLILQNGLYSLWFTNTGNLAVLLNNNIVYQTSTSGVRYLTMQYDGNLTMATITKQVWFTNTYGNPDAYLVLGTNGSLAILASKLTTILFNGVANTSPTGPTAR